MHREEARDALERARAMQAKVGPRGRWYAVYGFGFGLTSMVLLLIIGITGTVTGVLVGLAFYLVMLTALILYSRRQPVQPLGYARLHNWGIGVWAPVYATAVVAGSIFFQGESAWWVPMAVLSALPTSVAALVVLRRSRSAQ
ncbi:hypothetical protein ACWFMI_26410 [Nocardiopsis terrae]